MDHKVLIYFLHKILHLHNLHTLWFSYPDTACLFSLDFLFQQKTDKIDKLGSKRGAALYKFNGKAYRKDPKFKI